MLGLEVGWIGFGGHAQLTHARMRSECDQCCVGLFAIPFLERSLNRPKLVSVHGEFSSDLSRTPNVPGERRESEIAEAYP